MELPLKTRIHICLFKYDLGQKYYAPQVRPDWGWGSNSRPPDHDSTLHVTETPSLATRPSVTSIHMYVCVFQIMVK